jgi:hypothetical protein
MEEVPGAPLPEPFADAVRWPVDAHEVRLRLGDKLAARLPVIARRVAPRLLAEPAGSRGRRWLLTRGLTAGFAAADGGDWDYLERIYEPGISLTMHPEVAPDLPARSEGFAAFRSVLESIYEIMANADSNPVEIIDLGGAHFVARNQWASEGVYSGLEMNRRMVQLYEMTENGRIGLQWTCVDLETAEELYAERLADLRSPDRPVSPGR